MKKTLFITLFFLCLGSFLSAQTDYNWQNYEPDDVEISEEEQKLYHLVMQYRKERGLAAIPLARSLTYVAQVHCWDLETNQPDQGKCNLHSWSDQGNWSPCCYTPDHRAAKCLWNKPREITDYEGSGYEISYMTSEAQVTAKKALDRWKRSPGHNNFILNQGMWKDHDWQSIGIGIYGGYAVIWFGKESEK